MLSDALSAYPLGLGGSPFWPYSGPHPGNSAATVAAYWVARTESQLEFETQHLDSCMRLRHEDVIAQPRPPGWLAACLPGQVYNRLGPLALIVIMESS
ncbi:MAG TPA: hypothetical protein VN767_23120 [Streptosporangiaceae bacterium]|nr:hypothetical protein [Streptosporangiaceae bacterium]